VLNGCEIKHGVPVIMSIEKKPEEDVKDTNDTNCLNTTTFKGLNINDIAIDEQILVPMVKEDGKEVIKRPTLLK